MNYLVSGVRKVEAHILEFPARIVNDSERSEDQVLCALEDEIGQAPVDGAILPAMGADYLLPS